MFDRPTPFALTLSFLTALLVANVSGPQYVYPAFGTSLTTQFQWTALETSLVSTASFMGMSFSGPLCAWLVEHLGVRSTLRVSALLAFAGPFLVAQTYAGRLPAHFILCAIYLMLLGVAGAAAYLCALESQSHNFKNHRGMSMGLTSASLGLCGLVFSQINDHFFENRADPNDNNTYGLLMFMALVMSGSMMVGSFVLGPLVPNEPVDVKDHLFSDQENELPEEQQPLLAQPKVYSGIDFFTHPVGFALFFTLFIVLGFGYVYLANVGQILLALPPSATAGPQHLRNIHVSLFGLANCGARAAFGTLSDLLKSRWGIHRVWVFVGAAFGLLVSMVYLVGYVATPEALVPCTIMVAIVYGTVFGVAPATTTEFGIDVFARNWGWLLYAPAFGSQIFNVLFGAVYDHEAANQGTLLCQGAVCFQTTFLVGIGCAALCISVLAWAIARKRLYIPWNIL